MYKALKEDLDILDQGFEEMPRPEIDFSEWHDDSDSIAFGSKSDGNKFRPLDLQPMDQLLATTKSLVPEQMVIVHKVLAFAKSTIQCRNSKLSRDSPHKLGILSMVAGA